MENRLRILLLASLVTLTSGCATMHRLWPWHRHVDPQVAAQKADTEADAAAAAADTAPPPTVIDPQVVRRKIKVPKIKAKDIELGANFGDEGKGVLTDYLASRVRTRGVVVRHNGGAHYSACQLARFHGGGMTWRPYSLYADHSRLI